MANRTDGYSNASREEESTLAFVPETAMPVRDASLKWFATCRICNGLGWSCLETKDAKAKGVMEGCRQVLHVGGLPIKGLNSTTCPVQ
jgi:hypothetical protein